jgi:type IV pilus assembly protein PilZ
MSEAAPDPAVKRPGVYSLVIRTRSALYAAWMPLLRGGGIFVPSTDERQLGEDALVLLSLLDEAGRIPIHGHVAWINPVHAASNRPQGFGVQLQDNDTCRELRKKVETALGGALQSTRLTHTL